MVVNTIRNHPGFARPDKKASYGLTIWAFLTWISWQKKQKQALFGSHVINTRSFCSTTAETWHCSLSCKIKLLLKSTFQFFLAKIISSLAVCSPSKLTNKPLQNAYENCVNMPAK